MNILMFFYWQIDFYPLLYQQVMKMWSKFCLKTKRIKIAKTIQIGRLFIGVFFSVCLSESWNLFDFHNLFQIKSFKSVAILHRSTLNVHCPFYFTDYTSISGILIENGADVNSQNHRGKTPIHFAVENGKNKNTHRFLSTTFNFCQYFTLDHNDIIGLMLQHGGNVSIPDENGVTPFFLVVKSGESTRISHELIDQMNINFMNEFK